MAGERIARLASIKQDAPVWLPCPLLGIDVEPTDERFSHVILDHIELASDGPERIAETLADPDLIMKSRRSQTALLFSRWYDGFLNGKYLIVVVERDSGGRHWVITAHPSDAEIRGDVIWRKS